MELPIDKLKLRQLFPAKPYRFRSRFFQTCLVAEPEPAKFGNKKSPSILPEGLFKMLQIKLTPLFRWQYARCFL
jgi:hypothetical protein